LYSAPSAENIPSIKQKNSKILRNTVIVLLGIIIFAIFVAIAVFMGNSSDKPTDTNGIVEYEEIRN